MLIDEHDGYMYSKELLRSQVVYSPVCQREWTSPLSRHSQLHSFSSTHWKHYLQNVAFETVLSPKQKDVKSYLIQVPPLWQGWCWQTVAPQFWMFCPPIASPTTYSSLEPICSSCMQPMKSETFPLLWCSSERDGTPPRNVWPNTTWALGGRKVTGVKINNDDFILLIYSRWIYLEYILKCYLFLNFEAAIIPVFSVTTVLIFQKSFWFAAQETYYNHYWKL